MPETPPWVVRFVDRPDPDRTVRLDLNDEQADGIVYVRPEGFSLGTAEMLATITESMLTESREVTARRRETRELVVPLAIVGEDSDVAAVINAVAREADRSHNWLEFKPGEHTGESVFFKVLQGDVGEVDLDPDEYPQVKGAQLTLLCEPTAVGLPVTGSVAALSNNPASGQVVTLPEIRGDVAAPLNVEASWQTAVLTGRTMLVGTHVNPGAPARVVLQAEAATSLSNNTSVQAADAAMSGSGSNYVRSTFATVPGLATRVAWSGLAQQGRFKVLARVRKTAAADVFTLRHVALGGGVVNGPTVTYGPTTTTGPHVLDLGQVTLPVGSPLPPGGAPSSSLLQVQAGRSSGAGSLDVDVVVLVPVEVPDAPDVRTCWTWLAAGGAGATSPVTVGWNAEADEVYTLSGANAGWTSVRRGGSMPMVHPGHDNHLLLMRHVGLVPDADGTITADAVADTTDVAWDYRPRYLYVSEP